MWTQIDAKITRDVDFSGRLEQLFRKIELARPLDPLHVVRADDIADDLLPMRQHRHGKNVITKRMADMNFRNSPPRSRIALRPAEYAKVRKVCSEVGANDFEADRIGFEVPMRARHDNSRNFKSTTRVHQVIPTICCQNVEVKPLLHPSRKGLLESALARIALLDRQDSAASVVVDDRHVEPAALLQKLYVALHVGFDR